MSPTVFQPCESRDDAVLCGVVEVLEVEPALEVDLAGLTRRQFVAVLVEDVERAHHRLADRSGMRQPVLGGDQGRTDGLRGGVVLVDDRPPPVDHLLLDLHRARRRRVHDPLQTGHVVRIAHGLRQFQHPGEHHRDELAVGDADAAAMASSAPSASNFSRTTVVMPPACVCIDHTDGAVWYSGAGLRYTASGFIQNPTSAGHHARRLGGRYVRQFALDALRAAGGARGVLQQVALDLVVDRGIRLVGNTFRVALPAVEFTVGDQQHLGQPVGQLGAELGERRHATRRSRRWPWRRCCR